VTGSERRRIAVVMLCHFIAALAALGMPPFFALILLQSFDSSQTQLVGWFYVLPTLCTALAAPWWGRFADRYGTRRSLLRAQLGLALGFLLASLAPSPLLFALALMVQGLLGGTFAASSAHLASLVQGAGLAQSLNWMQGSARAALVVAPVLFGWLIGFVAPLELYGYLALLPLLAALLLLLALPAGAAAGPTRPGDKPAAVVHEQVSGSLLFMLQFGFSFACVIGFPYFIADIQLRFAALDAVQLAWLFSLPHLVYLLLAHPCGIWLRSWPVLRCLQVAFVLLALSYWGQYRAYGLTELVLLRLLMGIAMTICFVALHRLMSASSGRSAGRLFGRLDAAAKWAGVAAGLSAGALSSLHGLSSPLLAAALVLLSLCLLVQFASRTTPFIQTERS
jgi:MFS family permease